MISDQARAALVESLKAATPDQVVAQYLAVRDKKSSLTKTYEEQTEGLNAILDMLSGYLLDYLSANRLKNSKTESGATFYKSSRTTASVADGEAFIKFVADGHWDLIERRANATACADFLAEHKNPVPGINLSNRVTIGVRRGTSANEE